MSRAVDDELLQLLDEASSHGVCYIPRGPDASRIRRALSRRVAKDEVVSPTRGLFVSVPTWESLNRSEQSRCLIRSLQLLHPEWVFSGYSAALMLGIDVSNDLQAHVHLAVLPGRRTARTRLTIPHAVLSEIPCGQESVVVDGVTITEPRQTVFDCLRWVRFDYALGIADSALRLGLVDRDDLEAYVQDQSVALKGRDEALSVLAWSDPRSENGGESIVRGRMLMLGYMAPDLQVPVPDLVGGGDPYRVDYLWVRSDGRVVVGELDGTDKYLNKEMTGGRDMMDVVFKERGRESRITMFDVSVLRIPFSLTRNARQFSELLDAYGVPKAGSPLASQPGEQRILNWGELRRT